VEVPPVSLCEHGINALYGRIEKQYIFCKSVDPSLRRGLSRIYDKFLVGLSEQKLSEIPHYDQTCVRVHTLLSGICAHATYKALQQKAQSEMITWHDEFVKECMKLGITFLKAKDVLKFPENDDSVAFIEFNKHLDSSFEHTVVELQAYHILEEAVKYLASQHGKYESLPLITFELHEAKLLSQQNAYCVLW
jgi:hypothetical protein